MNNRIKETVFTGVLRAALAVGLLALGRRARQDHLVDRTTEELHAGLMAFFEDFESYVMLNDAPASALVEFLETSGHLAERPLNPATGEPFTLMEGDPEIRFYVTEEDFKAFRLERRAH